MGWRQILTDYFHFTQKDRIAIFVIVLLIATLFLLPTLGSKSSNTSVAQDTSWITSMKRLEQAEKSQETSSYRNEENNQQYQYDRPTGHYTKTKGELFYFDPNTLAAAGWQRLGLREKTIQTIQNYLSKGGKFRKPEDVQRIYGLFPDEYERIAPYIQIENQISGEANTSPNTPTTAQSKPTTPRYAIADINTADTSSLISLPGIGSKLAARIVGFRDKLGGFYSTEQIKETYGLPDSTFQKIKQYIKLNAPVKKININTATADELKNHPYIKWTLANPIVAYRTQHGLFTQISDLKKILVITDDVYQKLAPYLSVN